MYKAATLNDRMLGHGEPIRVREGERVLFRLLNASGNMGISLSLPGHRFNVVAFDGNPVPKPAAVDVLNLDVAERADVIVEMNNPGVWVFGSADDMDRETGMGVVVEYANRSGEPKWIAPKNTAWDYTVFGHSGSAAEPDETVSLKFEKIPGGRGGYNRWTINGKSWPDTESSFYGAARQALSPRHGQSQRRRTSHTHAPAHVRNHEGWGQDNVRRHERHDINASILDRGD